MIEEVIIDEIPSTFEQKLSRIDAKVKIDYMLKDICNKDAEKDSISRDINVKIKILEKTISLYTESINNKIWEGEILNNYKLLLLKEEIKLNEYKEKYPEYFL